MIDETLVSFEVDMGDLTKNFSRSEFACPCCGKQYPVDIELVLILQDLRDYFGKPVKINSAVRCNKHNKAINGREHSKHLDCIAADIAVAETKPEDVQEYLEAMYPDRYGIGAYKTFTHIDIRITYARW